MARRKRGRDVSGFVLLDKPCGPTSNQALQRVRRLFDARKAGHTGTLDPLATGMLPICLGAATKTAALAIAASKHYEATGLLGAATDTGDSMGEVTGHADIAGIGPAEIAAAVGEFSGEIEQIPPRYSAVRHEGRRLYELARKGIEVEAAPRRVTIHSIELCGVALPQFTVRVHCSKGTYIRTLIEDIGRRLGTLAHVTALRRIAVDPFTGRSMVTLERLEAAASTQAGLDAFLLPVDCVLTDWPKIELRPELAERIRQGQRVVLEMAPSAGKYRIYQAHSVFVGIGDVTPAGELVPRRIFL